MSTSLAGPRATALPWGTGASGLRLLPRRSATQLRERAEKHAPPGTPAQEPIEQTPTRAHDLARQGDQGVDNGPERHRQWRRLVLPVLHRRAARTVGRP